MYIYNIVCYLEDIYADSADIYVDYIYVQYIYADFDSSRSMVGPENLYF